MFGLYAQLFAQVNEQTEKEVLLKRENSGYLSANSSGIGFGYRSGWFKTGYKLRILEFGFSTNRDLKQIKLLNKYRDSRYYYYGKLISYYNFRALYGVQKTITTKPYWGGVEFRTVVQGGFNLGIGKPIYLYVASPYDNNQFILQRYEEDKVLQQDIYGRGPFSKGLSELQYYPGLSLKLGLNAEFGDESTSVRAFEIGFMLDAFLKPIKMMAFEDAKYAFFHLYLSYHFGSRFNP